MIYCFIFYFLIKLKINTLDLQETPYGVRYRGRPGRLELTLDFAESHKIFGSAVVNHGVSTLDNEPKPTPT